MKYKYFALFYFKYKGREEAAIKRPALTSIKNVNIDVPEGKNFIEDSDPMKDYKIVDNENLWDKLKGFFEEGITRSYFTIVTNDKNIINGEKYKKICDVYMKTVGKMQFDWLKFSISLQRKKLEEDEKKLNYLRNFV